MRVINEETGPSLVAQWLGICLTMQGHRLSPWLGGWGQDPTGLGTTKPTCHARVPPVKGSVMRSCLTLCCGPPASSVLGILQARILEWAAMPFSRVLCYIFSSIHLPSFFCRLASLLTICIIYYPNLQLTLSYIQIRSDQIRSVAQSCPTLCDPMNRSTPGLPVHHQIGRAHV